jgi:hypothetical protein
MFFATVGVFLISWCIQLNMNMVSEPEVSSSNPGWPLIKV